MSLNATLLKTFGKDLLAGALPNKAYERLTSTFVLLLLPSMLFAPLRFVVDKSEQRTKNLIRDLTSTWTGLAAFFTMRKFMNTALKNTVKHEPLRFMVSVLAGVFVRLGFQTYGAVRISEKFDEFHQKWKPQQNKVPAEAIQPKRPVLNPSFDPQPSPTFKTTPIIQQGERTQAPVAQKPQGHLLRGQQQTIRAHHAKTHNPFPVAPAQRQPINNNVGYYRPAPVTTAPSPFTRSF